MAFLSFHLRSSLQGNFDGLVHTDGRALGSSFRSINHAIDLVPKYGPLMVYVTTMGPSNSFSSLSSCFGVGI